ncbi:MAG: hypothetical protein COT13_02120 [Chloroflexi bacterium CG08_land_8_20_14_0_20_45_12]|nr:MAG: hypothetical protein AUK00_00015 [Dehalococcoidia bacterium CG2_30_46_9]PIU23603.1 MAG: hypothetical protein COT13_02120 [Chloroflexi bacterium CG08_land_8_20_14_0_20_45_12]PIX26807.1 MAG: hypothetical protein COZ67_05685 [Chloroflexi bacterium CG_4_8_14_3_um_filter_45_15]
MCSSQEQAYELPYKLACEKLASMNITQQCLNSGAQYVDPDKVIVEYLNQSYVITIPSMEISLRDRLRHCEGQSPEAISHGQGGEEEIPLKDKILILHYLISAKGTPTSNKLISFRQLPGGASYFTAFSQRTVTPLLRRFGKEPELLIGAAEKLGGCKANYGDVAVSIKAFPKVPITTVLWRGDSEFAPRGNIMFDSTISDYLSTEDISVLCEGIVGKLINS